jgi:hypothetical protein
MYRPAFTEREHQKPSEQRRDHQCKEEPAEAASTALAGCLADDCRKAKPEE